MKAQFPLHRDRVVIAGRGRPPERDGWRRTLRHFMRATRIASISGLGLGAVLALSACSAQRVIHTAAPSSATPSAGALPATAQPISSPVATSASAATAVPAATPSVTFVPIQRFPEGGFYSPSGNISCELNYHLDGQTLMSCQTIAPRVWVEMGVTGNYKIVCTGQRCGPSSPQPAPTLAYGTATEAGPFRCTSATTGVICLADGKGFQISRSGVTPVSA